MLRRPRRNRRTAQIRELTAETTLQVSDLVQPLFLVDGEGIKEEISSMPGCYRFSVDSACEYCRELFDLGIKAVAPFPKIEESQKDSFGKQATNHRGVMPRAIEQIKKSVPELVVISDVALDPYSSDGHDGVVRDGEVVNDVTLDILAGMALLHARCGADYVAPSDMMDGRVGAIRASLDDNDLTNVGIISYSAKYCSGFYGPFRDALDSAPKSGDKKTYQMDPANSREALLEVELDIAEGADVVMVKPALSYLDIISEVKASTMVPVAAYNVSGEYAMIKAAGAQGWIEEKTVRDEVLLSIKRAGADIIFTYFADEFAREH